MVYTAEMMKKFRASEAHKTALALKRKYMEGFITREEYENKVYFRLSMIRLSNVLEK